MTVEKLKQIHKRLESLRPLGALAIQRRAQDIVADEINRLSPADSVPKCGGGCFSRDGWKQACRVSASFEFVHAELESEDRRRSVFVDPIEIMTQQFYDFGVGRLDVLEMRIPPSITPDMIASAKEQADRYINERPEKVHVNINTQTDINALINTLKGLASSLEQSMGNNAIPGLIDQPEIGSLARANSCELIRIEAGAIRQSDDGKKQEQLKRSVYSCLDDDACCTNQTYTKYGDWAWDTIWVDGDPSKEPIEPPKPFKRYPWKNDCPVFSAPMGEVSSDWGWRTKKDGSTDFHPAIDIAVPAGTPVFAMAPGKILRIKTRAPRGETYVIVGGGPEIQQYLHVTPSPTIKENQKVKIGTLLGHTNTIPRPHLHFARFTPPNGDWTLKKDANSINPCSN